MSSQDTHHQPPRGASVYEQFGGERAFTHLVESFYQRIGRDDSLRSMFPADLGPAKRRLALFLMQLFGGPGTYSEERGHPRLRLRHAPFPITPEASQRWLSHMLSALDEQLSADDSANRNLAAMQIRQYFERATGHLINRPAAELNSLP